MTKEQIRNLVGVVVVSAVVVVGAFFFGSRSLKKQAVESAVQNVAQAVQEAKVVPAPVAPAAIEQPAPVVTTREVQVAGASVRLAFSEARGTVTYSGIDTQAVDRFFAREVGEIDGLHYAMEGPDKVQVSYNGFSVLDDQIVADWLIEDARNLAK